MIDGSPVNVAGAAAASSGAFTAGAGVGAVLALRVVPPPG
jgi:hypothetical protein